MGEHWGVQLPDGSVIHLTPEGLFHVVLEAFLEDKNFRVVRDADPARRSQIIWRVAQVLQQPPQYRVTNQNCEVFANWLLGDPPKSPQVKGMLLLGAIALVLHLAE